MSGSKGSLRGQAGIPAAGGQLRGFPHAMRLDDLLVAPDEPRRGEPTRPETTREARPAERELLTIKQLVAYSTLSERTLRGYIHRKARPLPSFQVDKKIIVRKVDFDEWLARFRRAEQVDEIAQAVDEMLTGLTGPRSLADTRRHPMRRS